MIDLKRFNELKLKGAVSIVKAGTAYAVSYKKYDTATGEVLPEEVLGIDLRELANRKIELQKEIAEIDAFVAECQKIV